MLLNHYGEYIEINGRRYTIGDGITANKNSDEYKGLKGGILEIRDGADKETDNDEIDIICYFDEPTDAEQIQELEIRFTSLYDEPKKIDEIPLDYVVMNPSMIDVTSQYVDRGNKYTVTILNDGYINKYLCETKDDVRNRIVKEYHDNNICIGELLNTIIVDNMPVFEIVSLYANIVREIDGDLVQKIVYPGTKDEHILYFED